MRTPRERVSVLRLIGILLLMLCPAGVRVASAQVTFITPRPAAPSTPLTIDPAVASLAFAPAIDPAINIDPAIDQDPAAGPEKPTRGFISALSHNLVDDVKHLPRRNSLYWLVGGGIAALAVHPVDDDINRRLVGSDFADRFFAPGKYIGATEVQIGASITTYIVGRSRKQPRVQHIGMDLLEAQLLTEGIVELTKVAVRRDRPVNPDGSHYSGYSFPSGHSAVTFATATVFQQHFGWKAAVPTFTLATYVATSRLHDNRHFASDVVFGAAVGVIVGRSVTWHGRNSYHISLVPMGEGLGGIITW